MNTFLNISILFLLATLLYVTINDIDFSTKQLRAEQPIEETEVAEEPTRSFLVREIATDSVVREAPEKWAYYISNVDPQKIVESDVPFIVMDIENANGKFTASTVNEIKESGKKAIAYLSVGYAEKFRDYWKNSWKENSGNIGGQHKLWKNQYKVKNLLNDEWFDSVKNRIDELINIGYSGVMLSGLYDSLDRIKFLEKLNEYIISKNVSFEVYIEDIVDEEAIRFVDGLVIQNVAYVFGLVANENIDDILMKAHKYLENAKPVLWVSYVDENEKIKDVKEIAYGYGFVLFISNIQLDRI
jgi:uncharacterized protein (TIGR01370 family)